MPCDFIYMESKQVELVEVESRLVVGGWIKKWRCWSQSTEFQLDRRIGSDDLLHNIVMYVITYILKS